MEPEPLRYLCDRQRHLICLPYSVANLHRMARALGLGRHWYHGGDKPHYDLPVKRQVELQAQCELVSPRRILLEIQRARAGGARFR